MQRDFTLNVVLRAGGDNNIKPLRLRNALYVPNQETNFISCSALCADGYDINMKHVLCSVTRDREVFISTRGRHILYPGETCSNYSVGNAASVWVQSPSYTEDLLHARLGHANRVSVRQLLSSVAVQELGHRLSRLATPICSSCAHGEQARCARHFNPMKATKVGEVVQSDIWCQMSCGSLGGAW